MQSELIWDFKRILQWIYHADCPLLHVLHLLQLWQSHAGVFSLLTTVK